MGALSQHPIPEHMDSFARYLLSSTPSLGLSYPAAATDYLKQLFNLQTAWMTPHPGVAEGIKLFFFGTWLASCGLWIPALLEVFLDKVCVTATFTEGNHSYLWLKAWLDSNQTWNATARNVQVFCDSLVPLRPDPRTNAIPTDINWMQATYLPSVSSYVRLWYKWHPMTLSRREQNHSMAGHQILQSTITIRIYGAWSNLVLTDFLSEIQKAYLDDQKQTVSIYHREGNFWVSTQSYSRRDPTSLVLVPGQWEALRADALDFLSSREWYYERGIQYRRGYLLHGPPGSGKTSLIRTLAGALGLSVYPLILSQEGMDDSRLTTLVNALPKYCIAVMEDIDAAFTYSVNREDKSSNPNSSDATGKRVTLSGLLNALDGLSSHEGRIFIATTNKYGTLDPALIRPGRMDLHVKLENASKDQARRLFVKMYSQTSNIALNILDASSGSGDSGSQALSQLLSDGIPAATVSSRVVSGQDNASYNPMLVGMVHMAKGRKLDQSQLDRLAIQFSEAIPEGEFSMSSIQGFLLQHKVDPDMAVMDITRWVQKELDARKTASNVGMLPTSSSASTSGTPPGHQDVDIQSGAKFNDSKAVASPTPPLTPPDRTPAALPQNSESKGE
ncbi:Mitochondrial chaperone BCS1 [Hypsizygus marmoreus]|uniref:Mitochondrial chaperone BCS1 n=1 Tax=Hypsizygus marmoreus TaxID=39966 RepID=A0A369K2T3_HYPMA|nr:Mitochondrial chaperone BCS1 [Hypsizygus marmoreus]